MTSAKSNPGEQLWADPTLSKRIIDAFLSAYRQGAFPMADLDELDDLDDSAPAAANGNLTLDSPLPFAQSISWYRPDPRAILPILHSEAAEGRCLHIPSGLKRALKKHPFILTSDTCFQRVMRSCALPGPTRGGAWIDEHLLRCYTLLHHHGYAHSIECWLRRDDRTPLTLVGGIYGVSLGSLFCAESMFSLPDLGGSNSSSIALVTLVHHLQSLGYTLLDVQLANDHTLRFGVIEISADEYSQRLQRARIAGPLAAPPRERAVAGQSQKQKQPVIL